MGPNCTTKLGDKTQQQVNKQFFLLWSLLQVSALLEFLFSLPLVMVCDLEVEAEINYFCLQLLLVIAFITAIWSKLEQCFSTLLSYWYQHNKKNKLNLKSQDDRSLWPPAWCRCTVSNILPTWKLFFCLFLSLLLLPFDFYLCLHRVDESCMDVCVMYLI